ncbi:hypothetical protein [Sporisorium scitamineum]|uniref:Uncharacterized protein n=1 Tax=Sporisorium scitamineum TaxID=49012 RepID=A0A0F7S0I3_9BASI|nr:hypothetical protein [Sporisorium scitamineum]
MSSSNWQFLKAVPSFNIFSHLWTIYLTLCASSSPDYDLAVSLGRFYLHIAALQELFPWNQVVDYIVAICTERLGKASAANWAHFDNEVHLTHFQGLVAHNPSGSNVASNSKRPPP